MTKDSVYPVKTYESFEADPMDSILSAFSHLTKDEKACLQIMVEPLSEEWLKKMRKKGEQIKKHGVRSFLRRFWEFWFPDKKEKNGREKAETKHNFSPQQLGDFDKKMNDELFNVKIKAFATSIDKSRPQKIIDDLSRLFNQYNYLGLNTIKFTKAQDLRGFAQRFVQRIFLSEGSLLKRAFQSDKKNILNIKELSSIIHFPHGRFNQNPRISWQKYKIISVEDSLPKEGIVVGYNNF